MSKYIPGNQKHLTLNDRIYIENELSKGVTFKDIISSISGARFPISVTFMILPFVKFTLSNCSRLLNTCSAKFLLESK